MKPINLKYTYLILFLFLAVALRAQTTVSGKVTDAETAEGMPFVNVYFKGTTIGTTTDFEGYYKISTTSPTDTLIATYIGYDARGKSVKKGVSQTINFQLNPQLTKLEEVTVLAGENAAWPIMRKVIENKDINDKRTLGAYEYESYSKTEIVIDNLSEQFRKKKAFKRITQLFDSIKTIAGEDGKPVLPCFISETVSNYYYRKNPESKTENIIASKITGVGVDDGSLISQLIGTSFQEYNFYKNWLTIVEKEFSSPLSVGWKTNYDYYLSDSVEINGFKCYKIEIEPKRVQDLAFTGVIWITAETYALKQIDVSINKKANINFIEKIRIQQELEPTKLGPWLPTKTRILIDVDEIGSASPGVIAKFYVSNKNIVVNKPHLVKDYNQAFTMEEDALGKKDDYWVSHRHDSLSATEKNVYKMVDSIRNIPMIKNYIEFVNIAVNGFKKVGIVDIGPYIMLYSYNNIEGNRFRLGFKTNADFSKKIVLKSYLAYGTLDNVFKYNFQFNYIFSRKHWSEIGIQHKYDINQAGLIDNTNDLSNVFLFFANLGTLRRPFMQNINSLFLKSELKRGWQQKIEFKQESFNPLYDFLYYQKPNYLSNTFTTFEINSETRFAKNEVFITNDNQRISLGAGKYPIFTLNLTQGFQGVLNGNFNYSKVKFNIFQNIKMGKLGYAKYSFTAGKIFGTLPYPLLKIHLGNQTPYFNYRAFNLMNYFEFVSDTYASLKYDHYFEGLLTNRIPLIKRLKWRVLAGSNIIYGRASKANFNIIPDFDSSGEPIPKFNTLKDMPYIELNYGVENIFKFLRVDFIHRLTYFNAPNANKFGVKASFQFKL